MVAGIHSDDAITRQKGPPMMADDERSFPANIGERNACEGFSSQDGVGCVMQGIAVLEATKWVDESLECTALLCESNSHRL